MSSGLPPDIRKRYITILQGFEAGGEWVLSGMSQQMWDNVEELNKEGYLTGSSIWSVGNCISGGTAIGTTYRISLKGREYLQQLLDEEASMTVSAKARRAILWFLRYISNWVNLLIGGILGALGTLFVQWLLR